MKYFTLLLAFLGFSHILQSQVYQSSCEAPDSVIDLYENDARQLALREVFDQSSVYTDSILIPNELTDTILNAMIAVYNLNGLPERDSVIDIYNVRPRYLNSMNAFTILAPGNLSWMNSLEQGNLNTGFETLDTTIANYGFQVASYSDYNNQLSYHAVGFTTDGAYNLEALVKPLEQSSMVNDVIHDIAFIDQSNVKCFIHDNHIELRYLRRWGQCLSGCMYQRVWVFKIYNNCSVEFVNSYNGIEPDLGLTDQSESEFSIYPNPSEGIITIESKNDLDDYWIDVFNLRGEKIRSVKDAKQVDLELDSGIYLLQIRSGSKLVTVIKHIVK